MGLLKRARVCALLKGDIEQPSDITGVVYIRMVDNWTQQLPAELREVGFPADANKA